MNINLKNKNELLGLVSSILIIITVFSEIISIFFIKEVQTTFLSFDIYNKIALIFEYLMKILICIFIILRSYKIVKFPVAFLGLLYLYDCINSEFIIFSYIFDMLYFILFFILIILLENNKLPKLFMASFGIDSFMIYIIVSGFNSIKMFSFIYRLGLLLLTFLFDVLNNSSIKNSFDKNNNKITVRN